MFKLQAQVSRSN